MGQRGDDPLSLVFPCTTSTFAARLGPQLQHEQADRKLPAPLPPCCVRQMSCLSKAINHQCIAASQRVVMSPHTDTPWFLLASAVETPT